jgi:hypothetical protein
MKRLLVAFVALMLVVPSISYAGSVTSRWDMTLGGFVVFDAVYADKAVGVDNRLSPVDSKGGVDQASASTGNLTWAGGGTRLNWAIKGPEAYAAKTSAFIEGDFRGRIGNTEYGLFTIRHSYFQMIWPKTKLLIGHTWQAWGMVPSLTMLAMSENHFNKGANRVPQIRLTQALTKNFTGVFAVQAPYFVEMNTTSNGNVGNDAQANGLWPDVVLDFSYASDICGKIGPWGLKVGLGGFYGKDKYLLNEGTSSVLPHYTDKMLDRYGAGLYWYVPIIPQKKENKAGAVGFTGQLFAGKGMAGYLPAYTTSTATNAYIRNVGGASIPLPAFNGRSNVINTGNSGDFDLAYAMTQGGWVQGTFYITNKLFVNAVYGMEINRVSGMLKKGNTTGTLGGIAVTRQNIPERVQNFIVNVMYDVSAAVRFGLEYANVTTAYAYDETSTLANKGDFNTVRFGGYYFF